MTRDSHAVYLPELLQAGNLILFKDLDVIYTQDPKHDTSRDEILRSTITLENEYLSSL